MTDKTIAPNGTSPDHGCCGGDNAHAHPASGIANKMATAPVNVEAASGCCGGGKAEAKPALNVAVKREKSKAGGCGCGG